MLILKAIEDRGAGLAAVFYTDYGNELVLNEESLCIRIDNLNQAGINTDAERKTLIQMKYVKSNK